MHKLYKTVLEQWIENILKKVLFLFFHSESGGKFSYTPGRENCRCLNFRKDSICAKRRTIKVSPQRKSVGFAHHLQLSAILVKI